MHQKLRPDRSSREDRLPAKSCRRVNDTKEERGGVTGKMLPANGMCSSVKILRNLVKGPLALDDLNWNALVDSDTILVLRNSQHGAALGQLVGRAATATAAAAAAAARASFAA